LFHGATNFEALLYLHLVLGGDCAAKRIG